MELDNKARETFEIITQTFDQVESDLENAHARGEMDEKEYAISRTAALKERLGRCAMKFLAFERSSTVVSAASDL